MNSGLLRQERLKWYRRVSTENAYGTYKDADAPIYLGTVRAGLLNQTEQKQFINDELQYYQTKKFIVRHYIQIKENDIIIWNNKKWNVDEVLPNKYHNDKEIDCSIINE
jgi:hypothetical protein